MFYHRSPEATSETPDESTLEASNSVNIDQAQERHSRKTIAQSSVTSLASDRPIQSQQIAEDIMCLQPVARDNKGDDGQLPPGRASGDDDQFPLGWPIKIRQPRRKYVDSILSSRVRIERFKFQDGQMIDQSSVVQIIPEIFNHLRANKNRLGDAEVDKAW